MRIFLVIATRKIAAWLTTRALGQPLEPAAFIDSLKKRMSAALSDFDGRISKLAHVRIYFPNKKSDRGLFWVAKLEPQLEPKSLGMIKDRIGDEYGMLDLLDIFVEADRLVDFSRFFTQSGTKEVRSRDQLRPLLLLDLFADGTNVGIRRIAKANRFWCKSESGSGRMKGCGGSYRGKRCSRVVTLTRKSWFSMSAGTAPTN
jgi:hypothetical protein